MPTFGSSTNYVNVEADGTLVLGGNATVWDDLGGDATTLQQTGPGVSINFTEDTVEFTQSANLSDYMIKTVQLTHAWKVGSTIYPHLHTLQDRSGNPNYLFQYRWQVMGGTKTTGWTNLPCNTPVFTYTSGTIHQLYSTASGISAPVGAGISDIIQFKIFRDNANTSTAFSGSDSVAATVSVLSFDVHVECDTLGSRQITTK